MRPALLTIHLLATGLWLGAAAVVAVATFQNEPLAAFFAHDKIAIWASGAAALTGGLLCVFLPWGFLRFWWVLSKWLLTVVLASVQMLIVAPAVAEAAAKASLRTKHPVWQGIIQAACDTAGIAQLVVVAGLLALSYISLRKPWGRLRQTDPPGRTSRLVVAGSIVLTLSLTVWQVAMLDGLRAMAIATPDLLPLEGKTCAGTFAGGGGFSVSLLVEGGRITRFGVDQAPAVGYAELGTLVTERVVGGSTLDVDGITGATTSSRSVLKAAEIALTQCH